jgi:hypothetical protein
MANFETFTKRLVPLGKRPFVTIQKRGTISLNKAAYVALGEPDTVELLFDADERLVGLRSIEYLADHAYPVRGVGNDPTSYLVAGTAFTKYYGIDTTASRRWPAELIGDVLSIDLKTPGTVVTSNRAGHHQPAAGARLSETG